MGNRWGNSGNSVRNYFFWAPKSLQMVIAAMKLKDTCSLECPSSQGYGFSSSHVWMWELNYKQSWVLNNWCFWTVLLEKTLESPLGCKEIQPVHPKGNQSWVFIWRTDAEAETPILWPPDVKNWLIWKTLMLGKIEGRRKRGWQRMRQLDGITNSMNIRLDELRELVMDGRPGMLWLIGLQRVRHDWATELNWTILFKNQSLQISCSVVSDSLWPHGLQQSRPLHPSPISRAYSNSCTSNRYCHPAISSSIVPFSSCLQSLPAPGSFQMSHTCASGGQSIEVSASASVLSMNTQDLFPLGWTIGSPFCPRDCQESSPTARFKSINSSVLRFLYSPTLTSIHDYWKNHSFD